MGPVQKFICRAVDEDEPEKRAYVVGCSRHPDYNRFYEWAYTIKPVHSYSDFPREYIVFSEEDEKTMLEKFKDNISL